MADEGHNEISIKVTAADQDAVTTFDRVKAKSEELGRTPIKLPVKADDPVTDAWRAKVNAEIRAAARESLKIPMGVEDADRFRVKVGEVLASLKGVAREEIPLQAVDADRFKTDVLKAVADARARIEAFSTRGVVADATPTSVPLTALNPLDAAWRQQVEASIKAISKDALKIPATPDMAAYRDELGAQLDKIRMDVRQDIRADLTDTDAFKAETIALVQRIQAEVTAKIPAEVDDKKAKESGQAAGISMGGAIAGGIALAAPLVAGAAVGVGVVALAGLGAALQHGNPQVQAGWAQLASGAKWAGASASSAMVAPITVAMDRINDLVTSEEPTFRSMFQAAGQDVVPLTDGLVGLAQNALPGLDNAMRSSMPIAQGLAQVERDVGTAVGSIGNSIAANSSKIGQGFTDFGGTAKVAGKAVGDVVGITSSFATGAIPVLTGALTGAEAVLRGVDQSLGPLTSGLGGAGAAALTAWLAFKGVSAVKSGFESLSTGMTSMSTKLTDFAAKAETASPRLASLASGAANVVNKIGPGGLVGVAGVAAAAVGVYSAVVGDATAQEQALTQQTGSLTQALQASGGALDGGVNAAIANLAQNTNDANRGFTLLGIRVGDDSQTISKDLQTAGISMGDFTSAIEGGGDKLQKLRSLLAHEFFLGPSEEARKAAGEINSAIPGIEGAFQTAEKNAKDLNDAEKAGVTVTNSFQETWSNFGNAISKSASDFNTATSGIKSLTDATVSADSGFFSAQTSFVQLDHAVEQAQHGVAQASLGVASARHSEQQAALGVTQAQASYRQSLQAEQQAQNAVIAARKAAQQQLEDLQRQVTDAADTQAEAQVRLFDAQDAVNKAGLQGRTLAGLGPLTSGNEQQFQLLLALQEAQHNLNDVNAQGAQLADQNAQAQAAGVNGAQGVVQAQQQLVSSQQAVAQAAQAVKDAQYAEEQAHQATKDAQYQEAQAQQQLTQAKDASSRSTDLSTAAGARNFTSIEGLFEANLKATGSVKDATLATESQASQLNFTRQQVDNVIGSLTGLDGKTAQFGIVGQPSVDISKIVAAAVQQGIDPEGLGFSPSQVQTALGGTPRKTGSVHPYAAGGAASGGLALVGEYGPEVVRLPVGSQVYPTANLAGALDGVPGYASGGVTSALIGANLRLGTWGGAVAATGNTYSALGYQNIPQLPVSNPQAAPLTSQAAFAGSSSSTGLQGDRAANKAIMQQVFAGFGWGSGAEWSAADYLEMREAGYNNLAQNPTSTAFGLGQFLNCVPLDTEILTREGWKTWRTVVPGDETLGYNTDSGKLEWTSILAKVVKPPQRVVKLTVGNWSARVTPGHRWMSQRRTNEPVPEHAELRCPECGETRSKRGPFRSSKAVQVHLGRTHGLRRGVRPYMRVDEFVRTDAITKAHRLRVAGEVDDSAGNDMLSNAEVALLGWIVGDGHINHRSRTVNVCIYQSKTRFVPVIDELLVDIPHSRYWRDRNPGRHLPSVSWRLSSPYARDLLHRSRLLDGTPDEFVLGLSSKQRQIWLEAVWQAEGTTVRSGTDGEIRRISQNSGPWADAMTLAVYLCGYRPTRALEERSRYNPRHGDNYDITLGRPWIGGTAIHREELGEHPVWCVNTALGTWTMRQDGLPMLTGNSTWASYGIAKTADPSLQSLGMARYIGARYGDPIGAAAHERAYNWYASGGPTSHGASVVGERGPEVVRLPGGGGSGSGSPYEVKVVIDISGATDGAFATAFMRMVRTGQIQMTANGQRVKVG